MNFRLNDIIIYESGNYSMLSIVISLSPFRVDDIELLNANYSIQKIENYMLQVDETVKVNLGQINPDNLKTTHPELYI